MDGKIQKLGVIGASGTLGKVAVRTLLAQNADLAIHALVRREDQELHELTRCEVSTGGMLDPAALDALFESSDVVVNLAAMNPEGQDKDLANLDAFLSVNCLGAAMVAATAAKHGKPLLHFSTVSVYETGALHDGDYLLESEPLPADDDASVRYYEQATDALVGSASSVSEMSDGWQSFATANAYPEHAPVYGLTKIVGERAVRSICSGVSCVRMCDVYGPGHESRGVVTDHLQALGQSDNVVVDFGFRKTVSYIFIDDVIRLIDIVAGRLGNGQQSPEVVNFVGPWIDENGFVNELRGLCDSHGLAKSIAAVEDDGNKVDRRYSTDVFQALLPEFRITPIAEGLQATWSALADQA